MAINLKRDSRLFNDFNISGIPWVTASTTKTTVKEHIFKYDSVEKMTSTLFVQHTGTSGSLKVSFTSAGMTSNYWTLSAGSTLNIPVMCSRIYISGTLAETPYAVLAPFTATDASHFPGYLSSSAGFEAV
jgi:hypothetical protein